MTEQTKEYAYYNGGIGNWSEGSTQPVERKYVIVQSLWTKPITDKAKLRDTLFFTALSLEYAHRSGYKVHMHTDRQGMELLKKYGYEELLPTLEDIPKSVPTELFAAGKFFAMRAEGALGKVHVDVDVLLKKPGVLDKFYKNNKIDVICQMEEDMPYVCHDNIILPMFILGYPVSTRPNWRGSMNTGIIGFNSPILASKYMSNYFEALGMYTVEQFEQYKKENAGACMFFDFILEQVNLSHMSTGFNVCTLLPTKEPHIVADKIGYQHLQGSAKWNDILKIKRKLRELNPKLYGQANIVARKIKD